MQHSPQPPHDPHHLLHHRYRWRRLAPCLGVLALGLLILLAAMWHAHPAVGRIEDWGHLPHWWIGGFLATIAAAAALWFVRGNLHKSAAKLDMQLSAKNRLETAASLAARNDPLAQAQREETGVFLSQTPVKTHRPAIIGLAACVALLVAAHLATLLTWARPWANPQTVAAAAAAAAPTPAGPAAPKASIKWVSPKSESNAAPIEEVPLEAQADSETGLRDLTLNIEVNGETKLKTPVQLDEIAKPGPHKIGTSMFLDQLQVQAFDIVSYHLSAQRIAAAALPETVSPEQFVEVRPFRDDVHEASGPKGTSMPVTDNGNSNLARALKSAQLHLLKENFVLAHSDLAHTGSDWQNENTHVASEQGVLKDKTGQAIQAFVKQGMAAQVINLLTQAQPLMATAADKIKAAQNEPALVPQGKSLALITELEKYIVKAISQGSGSGSDPGQTQARNQAAASPNRPNSPNTPDPFEKDRDLELKQRGTTQAGELETLAAEQARLADDLSMSDSTTGTFGVAASPSPAASDTAQNSAQNSAQKDPTHIDGTFSERQTQISQRVGAVLNGTALSPEVTKHLEAGRQSAREALQQLDAEDVARSREPAAAAARELQAAVTAMDAEGRQQAQQQMDAAIHVLNKAADQARNAPRQGNQQAAQQMAQQAQAQAAQAQQDLARAAQQQQAGGSAMSAKQLMDLAKALNSQQTRDALNKLQAAPQDAAAAKTAANNLQHLADQAARKPGHAGPTADELNRLAQNLERERANLNHLAALPNAGQPNGAQGNTTPANPQPGAQSQPGNQSAGQAAQGQNATTPQGEGQRPGQGQGTAQGREGTGQENPGGPATVLSGGAAGSLTEQKDITARAGDMHGSATTYGAIPKFTGAHPTDHSGTGNPNPSAATLPDSDHVRFARELLDDLRDDASRATAALPGAGPEIDQLRNVLDTSTELTQAPQSNVIGTAQKLDAPIEGVILLVNAELQRIQRQHQLAEADPGEAPAPYRAAVADYFEQLSRDYARANPSDDQKPPAAK